MQHARDAAAMTAYGDGARFLHHTYADAEYAAKPGWLTVALAGLSGLGDASKVHKYMHVLWSYLIFPTSYRKMLFPCFLCRLQGIPTSYFLLQLFFIFTL